MKLIETGTSYWLILAFHWYAKCVLSRTREWDGGICSGKGKIFLVDYSFDFFF